jgi:hypothetical protein
VVLNIREIHNSRRKAHLYLLRIAFKGHGPCSTFPEPRHAFRPLPLERHTKVVSEFLTINLLSGSLHAVERLNWNLSYIRRESGHMKWIQHTREDLFLSIHGVSIRTAHMHLGTSMTSYINH